MTQNNNQHDCIDAEKLKAEVNDIIRTLQTKYTPNPLVSMEECVMAGEIEVLNLVLDTIEELRQEQPELGEYEQAKKDIILKVKQWITEIHRVCDITDENGYRLNIHSMYRSLEEFLK